MSDGTVLAPTLVRARKPHTCVLCGTPITKGTTHHRWAWFVDGTASTLRAHQSCDKVLLSLDYDDELCDEPVHEYVMGNRMVHKPSNPDLFVLPAKPAHLDVVGDDLADEWRAVWAALKAELDEPDDGLDIGSTCPGCRRGTLDAHLSCPTCGWENGDAPGVFGGAA